MRRLFQLTLISACGLLGGVITGCSMTPPSGFVDLTAGPESRIFVAADDSKVLIREFMVPEGAPVEFWASAARREFEERRGYRTLDTQLYDDGAVLSYQAVVRGLEYTYRLYLSKSGRDRVRTVEYVALSDDFDRHLDDVDKKYRPSGRPKP